MNIVYAESSAVVAWLLSEDGYEAAFEELSHAEQIVTSALTMVECSRAVARARKTGRLTPAEELAALHLLDKAAGAWNVLAITDRVSDRARAAFPVEPIRTLDAIHLATAAVFAAALGSLRVLSLDDRVRQNATALGLTLVPA